VSERTDDYVVVGGGLAGLNCARWLREGGADGSILLVGRESDLPYDRSLCSKSYLRAETSREGALLRDDAWFADQRVEVLTRVSATGLDLGARALSLSSGDRVSFGQALLATGANVRRLGVPGSELEGIHYLRTLGNSDAIRQDAAGKRVVLIGGSYLGCEVAASLTELGSECVIVMQEDVTLSRGFGERAGDFFQARLQEHGVVVHGGDQLERFEGAGGRVTRVVTGGGLDLAADAVVVGAGAIPDLTLARAAGLAIGPNGGVVVDATLQTSVSGVYAAGDIAEYRSVVHDGDAIRIEHWDVAFSQGRTVAQNMLGANAPHDVVPYFFSDLSNWVSLEYVGPARTWDKEIVRGSFDKGEFCVLYLDQGRLVAALSVGRGEDLAEARRLIAAGGRVARGEPDLADPDADLRVL
jgi:3-phenylpropionate/trans-cinnamate dioxygenase ferredoxin reductase component